VAGARWVQTELLDKYRQANLRVYAVWFSMMPADSRAKWPPSLLTDSRVIHRWDAPKTIGRWYAPQTPEMRAQLSDGSTWSDRDILWDAYLLYAPDAMWNDTPTGLIRWGRTSWLDVTASARISIDSSQARGDPSDRTCDAASARLAIAASHMMAIDASRWRELDCDRTSVRFADREWRRRGSLIDLLAPTGGLPAA